MVHSLAVIQVLRACGSIPTLLHQIKKLIAAIAPKVERLLEAQGDSGSNPFRCTNLMLAGAPSVGGRPVKALHVGSSPTLPANVEIRDGVSDGSHWTPCK